MHTSASPIIGILAGMGPRSTGPFVDMVVTECQRQYGARDDIDFPKMMICSQPAPFYDDRPLDHAALEAAAREGLQHLERAGASFLAIASNTMHLYHQRLAASVGVPLLDMVALAVGAVPAAAQRVALIAARPIVESGLYQDGLRRRDIEAVPIELQANVEDILDAMRIASDGLKIAQWRTRLMASAEAAGADTLLVAGLDLSLVLGHASTPLQRVDAAKCLAREIVTQYLILRATSVQGDDERACAAGAAKTPAAGISLARPFEARPFEARRGEYTLSTDQARLNLDAVHAYLTRSYWTPGIPLDIVAAAARASLCFGLYDGASRQVGYARVITDRASYAYLCDVYVLEDHRGHGLGKWIMECVMQHPDLTGLRRFMLATRDAHGLYAQYGFTPLRAPERFMEIARPDIYRSGSAPGR